MKEIPGMKELCELARQKGCALEISMVPAMKRVNAAYFQPQVVHELDAQFDCYMLTYFQCWLMEKEIEVIPVRHSNGYNFHLYKNLRIIFVNPKKYVDDDGQEPRWSYHEALYHGIKFAMEELV